VLRLKDTVLREFGDQGADTLERYVVQLEYSVFWCIEMLRGSQGILAVLPEGIEDVVLDKGNVMELHQVKTRTEAQGPWTTAEVLPILCKLFYHRKAFPGKCCNYHFVSDRMAANRVNGKDQHAALYRIKFLLQIKHDGQTHNSEEAAELASIEAKIIPNIQKRMKEDYGETLAPEDARELFRACWIETDSVLLRNPDCIGSLATALESVTGSGDSRTPNELRRIVDRILLKVLRTIILTLKLEDRRVTAKDVLVCRSEVRNATVEGVDLDSLPGRSVLEKKVLLGGFDATEVGGFQRQMVHSDAVMRELRQLADPRELDRFVTHVLDEQLKARDHICRVNGVNAGPGPQILRHIRDSISCLLAESKLPSGFVDAQLCLGLMWRETDQCSLWWHALQKGIERR
jgi:hypothetical protein